MCDCPQDEDDNTEKIHTLDDIRSKSQPILFGNCNNTKDMEDQRNWKIITLLETPKDEDNICMEETLKPPSSNCSSDTTREYKFVDLREYDYSRGEEEVPEYPYAECKPCTPDDEEEEESEPDIECTLAIIKPDAMVCKNAIENRIIDEGFEIYQTRWLQLTPEQASEFYSDCYRQLNFAHLITYMSSAPIIVMVLAKHHGIQDWRSVIGPTKVTEARLYYPDTIRAKYGQRGDDFINAVHGSTSREQAEKEIHFFFPELIIEPLLKGEMASDYLWEVINTVLLEGLTLCCKEKPADPILWLANWLILNNPNKPKLQEDLAMIPT